MAEVLLGDDGRGYELARRLDSCGTWRAWLGESAYASFAPSLSSPTAWASFLSPANPQVHLQLRTRALLYDKASIALSLDRAPSDLSSISSSYLQLHGDDVYHLLENDERDRDGDGAATLKLSSRLAASPSKSSRSSIMTFGVESENDCTMQKEKQDELPDLWYDLFIEKHEWGKHLKSPSIDMDTRKRTPEGMSCYLRLIATKKSRIAFMDGKPKSLSKSAAENGILTQEVEDDVLVLPELMFPFNCVPDNNILPRSELGRPQNVETYGVLDYLPQLTTSLAMIERFGIRPEYLKVEFGRGKHRGKSSTDAGRTNLSPDQASKTAQKVIAQVLGSIGIDKGSDVSIQIFSQCLGNHICKLGRALKILADSYRKQFTSTELIKMFLKTTGYGNLGALSDFLNSNTGCLSHQIEQGHILQGQQEVHHLTPHQQLPRTVLSQSNTLRPQNLAFQQQQFQMQQIFQQHQQKLQMHMQQQQQMQLQNPQQQQQMQLQNPQLLLHLHQQKQVQMQQQQQFPMQMPQQHLSQQQIQSPQQQQQILTQSQQQTPIHQQQQPIQSQPQQLQMLQQHQQLALNPQQQIHMQRQALHQLRQRQISAVCNSAMTLEKERPVEVKIESMPERSGDRDGSFNSVNRQQLQFRNQQLAGASSHHTQSSASSHHTQSGKQFKQFTVQSPQLSTQGSFSVRTPPVKVEGFQELMGGGDGAASRQDPEELSLTSPSK